MSASDPGSVFHHLARQDVAGLHRSLVQTYLEQQTLLLEQLLHVVQNPSRTSALEKRRDGFRAYQSGVASGVDRWFDDAVTDFSAAIAIDRYDFVSHWFLAMIAAFHRIDLAKAETSFLEAAHYSWPIHATQSAAALVGAAFARLLRDDFEGVEEAASLAIERDARLPIAHLFRARALATQGRGEAAVEAVGTAISLDATCYERVQGDAALVARCPEMASFLSALRSRAEDEVRRRVAELEHSLPHAEEALTTSGGIDLSQFRDTGDDARRRLSSMQYHELLHKSTELGLTRARLFTEVDDRLFRVIAAARAQPEQANMEDIPSVLIGALAVGGIVGVIVGASTGSTGWGLGAGILLALVFWALIGIVVIGSQLTAQELQQRLDKWRRLRKDGGDEYS